MSYISIIASDYPIDEVKNPHIEYYSINEAIEKGVSLPDFVNESNDMNRDKPGTVLWADNRENLDEVSIKHIDKKNYVYYTQYTASNKRHFSYLSWEYTKERASSLIEHVRRHLEKTNEIEIWNIYVGDEKNKSLPRKCTIHLDELIPDCFENLFVNRHIDCITVCAESSR